MPFYAQIDKVALMKRGFEKYITAQGNVTFFDEKTVF